MHTVYCSMSSNVDHSSSNIPRRKNKAKGEKKKGINYQIPTERNDSHRRLAK